MSQFDTLVFYLCEYVVDDIQKRDLQLFVLYDFERKVYAVYGSRQSGVSDPNLIPKIKPFHFLLNKKNHVLEFIQSVVEINTRFVYSLYVFNGLPVFMSDISFHLLNNFRKRTHELSGWEFNSHNEYTLSRMVGMVKKAYTLYEFEEDIVEDDYV